MKNCTDCKHAIWKMTKSIRLHPSGEGRCNYPYRLKRPPASMYFVQEPMVCGGTINRKEELREDCVYFERGG